MKYIRNIFAVSAILLCVSCNNGKECIDAAYEQTRNHCPASEVASTLVSGQIDCKTLTNENAINLGVCLQYIDQSFSTVAPQDTTAVKLLKIEFDSTRAAHSVEVKTQISKLVKEINSEK